MGNPEDKDTVFIRDLVLDMFAGIYDHEKERKQRVIVNVIVDVEGNRHRTLNGIGEVLSYEELVNDITKLTQSKHFDLLETLCEEIAKICLGKKYSLAATVRAEKPDIMSNKSIVGIEIYRTKPEI